LGLVQAEDQGGGHGPAQFHQRRGRLPPDHFAVVGEPVHETVGEHAAERRQGDGQHGGDRLVPDVLVAVGEAAHEDVQPLPEVGADRRGTA
jgi:hypothetical protein